MNYGVWSKEEIKDWVHKYKNILRFELILKRSLLKKAKRKPRQESKIPVLSYNQRV